MTAAQALAELAADTDELEARGTVRPGYITRRRAQLQAIQAELKAAEQRVSKERQRADALGNEAMDTMERLELLSTAFLLMGMDPMPHMKRPQTDLPIYRKALKLLTTKMQEAGTTGKPWRGRWSWADRNYLLNGLLMEARLELGIEKMNELLKQYQKHGEQA